MRLRTATAFLLLVVPMLASAHAGHDQHHVGVVQGLLHPLSGIDHLLAMLAVGWWSAATTERRWWLAPSAFAAATFAGAWIGARGLFALPGIEPWIGASVLVFGALMLLALRLPAAMAMALAAAFGLFHGAAHGGELGGEAHGLGAWIAGMVLATLALHLAGALAGRGAVTHARWFTRLAGAGTAAVGAVLLAGTL